MFDPTKAKLAAACEVPGILYGLCIDEENSKLYGAGSDWSVYEVDLKAEKPTAENKWTNHKNYVSALAFQNGNVVSASYDRRIIWTDPETGKEVRKVIGSDHGWIRDLAVFPDGKHLASVADDMIVRVWDAENAVLLNSFEGHAKQTPQGYATALYCVAVSPDGKHVASGDRIGSVCIWDVESGKRVHQFEAPTFYTYDARTRVRSIGGIRCLRFSPDGKTLAIAGIGKVTNVDGFVGPCRVELWDWQTGKSKITCQDKHKAVLNDVVFHPNESTIIGGGGGDSGGVLAFWDSKKSQPTHKTKPKGHLQRVILDAEKDRLYSAGHNGFQIWTFDKS